MTISDIEHYLSVKHTSFDEEIEREINSQLDNAKTQKNEDKSNYLWCLRQIYIIQKHYVNAIKKLKEGLYEEAWNTFDAADIALSFLEDNFDVSLQDDKYYLMFISKMIKEYQKLFPYKYFFSRECIIKAEKCSICDKPISLRHPCGHKVGKLYMGELCTRIVTDFEFVAISIVTDPFDKYAILKLQEQEYNYGMLENLMKEIDSPFDEFQIETVKVLKPEYKNIGRNEKCPCGSNKKYKKCHLGTKDELMDHHKIQLLKHPTHNKSGFVGCFGTWK